MKGTIFSIAFIALLGIHCMDNVLAEGEDIADGNGKSDIKADDNLENGSGDGAKVEDNSVKVDNTNNNNNTINNTNEDSSFTDIPAKFISMFKIPKFY